MSDGTVLRIPGRRSTGWPAHWSFVYLSILASSTAPYTHNSMQLALLESFNTSGFHTHADHWAGCNTDVRTLRRTSIPLSLAIVMPSCSRILRSLLQYGCLQIAALSLQLTSIHFPCIVASHCPRILWGVLQYECPQIAVLSLQLNPIYFPCIGMSRRSRILCDLLQYRHLQIAALSL